MIFFFLYLAIEATCIAMMVLSRKMVLEFLNKHQFIETWADLEDFKTLVRPQMHLALSCIALAVVGFLVFLISFHRLGLIVFLPFFLFRIVAYTLAEIGKKAEQKSRDLICTTEELEFKYRQICKSWTDDAFPKF